MAKLYTNRAAALVKFWEAFGKVVQFISPRSKPPSFSLQGDGGGGQNHTASTWTPITITLEDVRLANAKMMVGLKPNFSQCPAEIRAKLRELEASIPGRLADAAALRVSGK